MMPVFNVTNIVLKLFNIFNVLCRSALIEAHANLEDVVDETEVVSRFRETALKLERRERVSGQEWREIRHLINKLEKRDIEIVHTETEKSIRIWLLCRTDVAVLKLQKMMKDGGLEDILIRLFSIFLKRKVRFTRFFRRLFKYKGQLKMKFIIAPEQFLHAQEYFEAFGNQLLFFLILEYFCCINIIYPCMDFT